ncbi:SCO2 protein [Scedosporium apiospermum]|uniref:SCO2 protein n=1 Tax=Pseudallescheria apiosperma TaxID=563466 RepID=A0A084FWA9_PSEDA|nr:SCO2 protein [Scedosporium apiospermum]KEZ39371.1 SCO2 protein [Scedosporium apiospermum]
MTRAVAAGWRSLQSVARQSTCCQARSISTRALRSTQARPVANASQILRQQFRQPQLTQKRTYKTVEEAKSRYSIGPFSWKAGILFVITCGGLVWYFEFEKQRMQRKRVAEATKGAGKPLVGGPFELLDQHGNKFTHEDLKGRYSLVYFGFTHCPDICPEELDKMAEMLDIVYENRPDSLIPVFVTCDPARDGPKELKEYLVEFHPKIVGLTGTYDQIKSMCKAYRVYFSTPPNVKPGQDYLVDHSVYFYLMDPEGDFVEALGRQHSPAAGAQVILDHMKDWRGQKKF